MSLLGYLYGQMRIGVLLVLIGVLEIMGFYNHERRFSKRWPGLSKRGHSKRRCRFLSLASLSADVCSVS